MNDDDLLIARLNNTEPSSIGALIEALRDFDERNMASNECLMEEFETLFRDIAFFYWGIPIEYREFSTYRSRKIDGHATYENIKQIIYPHPKFVEEFGRCNKPGQPVFYGANSIEATLLEWKIEEGQCAFGALFDLAEDKALNIVSIGDVDTYRRHRRTLTNAPDVASRIERAVNNLEEHARIGLQYVDAFLSEYFRRIPEKGKQNVYPLTTFFSDYILSHDFVDGIAFPSVRHLGGVNVVIKTSAFDEKLKMSRFFVSTPITHLGYGIFYYHIHTYGDALHENGDFRWNPVPVINGVPVPARMTIPYEPPPET